MIQAPSRYQDNHINSDLVYDTICKVLSDRADQVDWDAFTPAEWELLPAMAFPERVGPLVYRKFKDGNWPPDISLQAAATLMQQYYKTLKHNTRRFGELDHILATFDKAAISVIILKGAHLARTLYLDIGLRPMEDFDLLVRGQDLDQALSLANQMGFYEYIPELLPGMNQEIGHHYHLKNDNSTYLEIHWSLIAGGDDWRKPPDDWAWSQSDEILLWNKSGTQHLSLNLPANLLYLCAHISLQHGIALASLGWFFDIHLLIKGAGSQLDWVDLSNKAQKLGWSFALGATLAVVQDCFNTVIPNGYLNKLQQEGTKSASLVISKSIQSTPLDRARNAIAPYKGSMKIKIIFAHLFPSPALIRYHYHPQPQWLWPLYYPYRLWEITWKILSSLHHRCTTSPPP